MTRHTWLALISPSLLIILILWLPFGFQLSGLIEEWGTLGLFTTHGVFFVADASSPLAAHRLRPLTALPHGVAYFLDSNSFNYWHVLLMFSLVLKGGASSFLAWSATRSFRWAMVMGVLVVIYPADTMQLSFRGVHINLALALMLLGASLHIAAYYQPRRLLSFCFGLSASCLLLVSMLMYEAAFALMPLPFFIIYAKEGLPRTWQMLRSRPELTLSWMAGAILFTGYALLAAPQGASYQGEILAERGLLATLYDALPKLVSIGTLRGLLGGWFDSVQMVTNEFSNYAYLSVASLACAGLIRFREKIFSAIDPQDLGCSPPGWAPVLRLGMVGMLLLLLGYAPYLFSNAHLAISQRTFLFATPGAVLVWLSVLISLAKLAKWVSGMAAFGLLLCGLGAQLYQFHHYVQIAETQRILLRNIVENFDGEVEGKTLVILDSSNRLNHTWMLRDNLIAALRYLYKRPIDHLEICLMPGGDWQRLDGLARMGKCDESNGNWTFRPAAPVSGPGFPSLAPVPEITIAKNKIILLSINIDGSITHNPSLNAYRERLQHGADDAALRYRHILARSPWPLGFKQFKEDEISDRYRWDFGKWWSLEVPTRGSGWREAEWQVNYFHHLSSAWKSQERSSLLFDLSPANKPYRLDGRFSGFVSEKIKDSLRVRLNGQDLAYRWGDDGRFEASISEGILVSAPNTIEFNSITDPNYYGLSASLDWFEVHPD
jgi:hypothetical protein